MNRVRLVSLSGVLVFLASTAGFTQTQSLAPQPVEPNAPDSSVIYGKDDRRDYGDPQVTANERRAADATALVVFGRVPQFAKHLGRPTKFSMPAAPRFCSPQTMAQLRNKGQLPANYPDEPFSNDGVLAAQGYCTAFKVGPDLVATAGHCAGVPNNPTMACSNINFVFNYHKSASRPVPENQISGTDVYQCREIIAREQRGRVDWAVVRVDRVIEAPQVSIRTSAMRPPGFETEKISATLIGHPAGLPLKIAAGGAFLRFHMEHFTTTLDAYGGNSGSPIFNTERLAKGELFVEGVLQGGSDDYVDWCRSPSRDRIVPTPRNTCSCAISYRCNFNAESAKACTGEIGVYARHMERALVGVKASAR
jgi:V8-like Glu-specific endopeptidase